LIHCGDNLAVLKTLPDCSVHCCVTSPPYYNLRDYGHAGQIGMERTPEEYVAKLVEVFREVRRVLRNDGTLWLNLGDSYAATRKGSSGKGGKQQRNEGSVLSDRRAVAPSGVRPKDLLGIPWRVAFALQADGWRLRQDIIWAKSAPMPESVTDRCTKAHEYIFLLAKSSHYYFDAKAIEEPAAYAGQNRGGSTNRYEQNAAGMDNKQYDVRNKRSVWTVNPQPYRHAHFATYPPKLIEPCILAGCPVGGVVLDPFLGSGTTAFVAVELGRKFLGIELNPRYAELARNRVAVAQPPLPFGAGVGEGGIGEGDEGLTLLDVTTEEESQGGCDEVSA